METKTGHWSCKEKRIEWLQQNQDLWKGKIDPYRPREHRSEIDQLAKAIQAAGLYSPKTVLCDIKSGMVKLLKDERFVH
jgi:hypothetical protein